MDFFGDLDNPLLSGYLSDQLNPVQSAKTDAHVACSSAERRSSDSTWSYSDAPDYNPGMNNPAELVPPALLPHVHLVSSYNYPSAHSIPVETVVEYLLQAPRITRDIATVGWKFLDPPRDGTVMLVWQPPQLGTTFASDGIVWGDAEYAFDTDARGYKLVMFKHKAGYVPQVDTHTTHSRRRYRLTGVANTNPNPLPFDPSLFLVHYCPADPPDRIPANSVAISRQANLFFTQRASFQQHGQLSRNEFMLHDRARWPTVSLPPNVNLAPNINIPPGNIIHPAQHAVAYPSNAMPHSGQSQQQHFAQQPQGRTSQANDDIPSNMRQRSRKLRARLDARAAAKVAASAVPTATDDEDGDPLDYLTPRDISTNRYKQHHEWMEEIYNSPFETSRIIPGEIGLGRKGEIEALTKEFFKAHLEAGPELTPEPERPGAGKLNQENLNQENLNQKNLNQENLNRENLNQENLNQENLNQENLNPENLNPENLNPENLDSEDLNPENVDPEKLYPERLGPEKMVAVRNAFKAYMAEQDAEIEEMKREFAQNMAAMEKSRRLGALERELRTAPMYSDNRDAANCMFDCSTGICGHNVSSSDSPRRTVSEIIREAEELLGIKLEETHEEVICLENGGLDETWAAAHGFSSGKSSTKSEVQLDQPIITTSQLDSSLAAHVRQQPPASMQMSEDPTTASQALASNEPSVVEDVAMEGISSTSERKLSDGNEWVIVGHENTSVSPHNPETGGIDSFVNIPMNEEGEGSNEALNTVGGSFDGFMPNAAGTTSEGFSSNDFTSTIDFGNLDSAGEALAGYGDLGLDESAFGAAYHGPQANPSEQHQMDEP